MDLMPNNEALWPSNRSQSGLSLQLGRRLFSQGASYSIQDLEPRSVLNCHFLTENEDLPLENGDSSLEKCRFVCQLVPASRPMSRRQTWAAGRYRPAAQVDLLRIEALR